MARLSVNINKVATLRNARGGNVPNVLKFAQDCEQFGAQGITVHPRPDERHIRRSDVTGLRPLIKTEFNIEGYPSEGFLNLVLQVRPDQVTLVPDPPDVLTSNAGWKVDQNKDLLTEVLSEFRAAGIRTSLFMEADESTVAKAKDVGADRIELYTESYAAQYVADRKKAISPFVAAAKAAAAAGLGINAGHDLSLDNIAYFNENIPDLLEVSIGHALISEALYLGLENVIQMYLQKLGSHG